MPTKQTRILFIAINGNAVVTIVPLYYCKCVEIQKNAINPIVEQIQVQKTKVSHLGTVKWNRITKVIKMPVLFQSYDDFLEDVLSLDIASEAATAGDNNDKTVQNASMFDFLVKEEPLGEDDLRALQKDRQKKDNHNMSK